MDLDGRRVERLRRRASTSRTCRPSGSRAVGRAAQRADDIGALRRDAIVICVPTPLGNYREPDISYIVGAARRAGRRHPPRPARRARVDDLSRHDAGDPAADSRGARPRRGPRLLPGLLARADRPRPQRLHAPRHPQGRRRRHRRPAPTSPPRSTARSCQRGRAGLLAGGGRDGQAAREHLPVGQHRAGQRVGALRPDGHRRLGGDRRGGDQAVRLHALRARPGLGGHCLPVDPFYLSWRLASTRTEFIELADKLNQAHAQFAWSRSSARSTTRPSRCAARGSWCSAWLTRPASATCAIRRRSRSSRCWSLGAEVVYHDPHIPDLPEFSLSWPSRWPELGRGHRRSSRPTRRLTMIGWCGGGARARLPRRDARHRGPEPGPAVSAPGDAGGDAAAPTG